MKTIVAVYTGKGLADPLQEKINYYLPHFRLVSLIDDTIIGECVRAGKVTDSVRKRLFDYYKAAEEMGADVILNTCSSVGDLVAEGQVLVKTPIVRIDQAMAEIAVSRYKKIAVVATLSTTLDPTARLLKTVAEENGKEIEIISGLAEGAYDALISGHPKRHDERIKQTVAELSDNGADCILLAQASMMRMEPVLRETVKTAVFSSPAPCLEALSEKYPQ